ncbi:MAG: putative toxin-antitoxin system toxin component, PIN family [Gammaproteobacteria bacterium]|nr:putative toxin-antitoxin system toxin component, PIN family [Gammaproteobacteria bacterium]
MRAERLVVDTNVLISAALSPQGQPRRVLEAVRSTNGALLFCDETFDELRSRLGRSKFDAYVSRNARAVFLAQLTMVAEWVSIAGSKLGCRDPDDGKLLETALAGGVDCLVTGDRDLLDMHPFRGIPVLTVAAFLAAMEEQQD